MKKVLDNRNSSTEYKVGLFDNMHDTILAVIPPLLLGVGSALAIFSNQLVVSIAAWVCIAVTISAGGAIALIRGMPAWGDTWLGSLLIFIALFLRLLMEEGILLSPLARGAITVLVITAVATLIIAITLKGWRRTGLVSIGLSSTLAIGIWNTFARPPFNKGELALLVAPIGIMTAACIYLYARKSDAVRILSLLVVWLICIFTVLVSNRVYQEWFSERGRAFPLITLMSILSILLWGGPFLSGIISTARKMAKIKLAKKNE